MVFKEQEWHKLRAQAAFKLIHLGMLAGNVILIVFDLSSPCAALFEIATLYGKAADNGFALAAVSFQGLFSNRMPTDWALPILVFD